MPRSVLLSAALALVAPAVAEDPPLVEPIDIGFEERTGRSLLFLDVEAVDGAAEPLLGLEKSDFRVRVNYVWRKIYSVDDLCPCGPEGAAPAEETARRAALAGPPRFVLYFDFSQLAPAGREQALDEARRWAAGAMQPEDRVSVVAFSSEAGLRRLGDDLVGREAVLQALDAAAADPELTDPFPGQQAARQQMCDDGTLSCYHVGSMEHRHARRSLETLRNYLTELDDIPARKTLLLFHENASIFPGRQYAEGASYLPQTVWDRLDALREPNFERQRAFRENAALVPDLLELSQEVGGAATASRTSVFPLACGTARTWSVNLGANLADATGGEYNRTAVEVAGLVAAAGRRCACMYRIGLEMEDPRGSFVLRTKVKARGQTLPSRYLIEHLSDEDRWMRKAQLVLANPEAWTDLAVGAAVSPLRPGGTKWDARVEVGFALPELETALDDEDEPVAEWEVAALLSDAAGERHWEMLGVYRARPTPATPLAGWVLHAREIAGLKPGRYELRAFVRDRSSDRYGTATASIDLPEAGGAGIIGPQAQLGEREHLTSPLPLREKVREAPATPAQRASGPLPLGDRAAVVQGEALRFATTFCGGAPAAVRSAVLRESDGRVFEGRTETLGAASHGCAALVQSIDTWGLEPGSYVYRLEAGAAEASAGFTVAAAN